MYNTIVVFWKYLSEIKKIKGIIFSDHLKISKVIFGLLESNACKSIDK